MEQDVHKKIKEVLVNIPGIWCDIIEHFRDNKTGPDAKLIINRNGVLKEYFLEFKMKILPAQVPNIKQQMNRYGPTILAAQYITTEAKKVLQNEDVPYIDTAGNVYINENDLFIFTETHKTNRTELEINANRAFYKTGLKVTYQFLIHPEYLNEPYRFIGEKAMVTIDTVRKVILGLLNEKYIIKADKNTYQFADRKRLFEEWVTAYNKNLRPKLKQRNFRWIDKEYEWRNIKLPEHACWGGTAAAEIMTDYIIANKYFIYTDQPYQELIKTLKIVPQPNGNITILEKFWKDNNHDLAHPMLVYADLINDPDPRNLEAANIIYNDHVKNNL